MFKFLASIVLFVAELVAAAFTFSYTFSLISQPSPSLLIFGVIGNLIAILIFTFVISKTVCLIRSTSSVFTKQSH